MSLESVFKLSLIMNMIDNLSGPMAGVASKVGANVSKLDAASQTFGNMAKAGAAMQETGSQIVNAVLAPVAARITPSGIGRVSILGVKRRIPRIRRPVRSVGTIRPATGALQCYDLLLERRFPPRP